MLGSLGSKKHRYHRCSLLDTSKKRDTFTGVSHAIDGNSFLWSLSTSSCIWCQHPSPVCPWAIVHLQKSQTLWTTSSKSWLFLVLQCFSLVSIKSKKGTQPRDPRSIHMLLKYVKLRSHCVENKAGKLNKDERQIDDLSSLAFDAAYDCEDIFARSPHRWLPYLDRMKILKLRMALRGQAMLPCGFHSFATWPKKIQRLQCENLMKGKHVSHQFMPWCWVLSECQDIISPQEKHEQIYIKMTKPTSSNLLSLRAKYQLVGLLKRSPRMELALAVRADALCRCVQAWSRSLKAFNFHQV